MIYAPMSHFHKYKIIPYIDQMVEFVKTRDMLKLPDGEVEIRGRDLFLRVFNYPTSKSRRAEDTQFEIHNIYADVHIVLRGAERMQALFADSARLLTDYDIKDDVQFFSENEGISDIILSHGEFAVFFPGEPHKPMCYYKDFDFPVAKFVFKVKAR